jgi:hypothetical protein
LISVIIFPRFTLYAHDGKLTSAEQFQCRSTASRAQEYLVFNVKRKITSIAPSSHPHGLDLNQRPGRYRIAAHELETKRERLRDNCRKFANLKPYLVDTLQSMPAGLIDYDLEQTLSNR